MHTAGQFMGDVGMLSGRRSLVRARMREGVSLAPHNSHQRSGLGEVPV